MKLYKIYTFALIFFVFSSEAVDIRFPDEELASETVLPLFEPEHMVLNRNITLKYRFEAGAGGTFGLDEPFYFPFYATGFASFYLSEVHGLSLTGTWLPPYYSSAGDDLAGKDPNNIICDKEEKDEQDQILRDASGKVSCLKYKLLDVHRLPYPQLMFFFNYQYTPYYGKISLTKKIVMNLSLYAFAGPGMIVFNENTRLFAFNMGIGQRIYLLRHLALRTDIGFYGYYGPDLTKIPTAEEISRENLPARLQQAPSPIPYSSVPPLGKTLWLHLTATIGLAVLL